MSVVHFFIFHLLYAPFVFVFYHAAVIGSTAIEDRVPATLYLVAGFAFHRSLVRSQVIVGAGLLYFVALSATWIIYCHMHGVGGP